MPALESVAAILRESGLPHATVKRHKFGAFVESVQLETGQHFTGATLERGSSPGIGIEVSAVLGFSLVIDGTVAWWSRPHGINIFEEEHPQMTTKKTIDPLVASLSLDDVVRMAAVWLEEAQSSSYRALRASRPLGFKTAEASADPPK